ncbi:MAG TPA: HDOD domain-containing protein [Pirellulaceae bacterium]|nr:HDOD domain-containing protein [Pirellulaceae bacterium]
MATTVISSNPSAPVLARELPAERRGALERLFTRISRVAPLPGIGQRILQLTDSDAACGDDLREAIQSDPLLAARILRRLNSAYYGLGHKVADFRTAVSLLGFREIRNLALTVLLAELCEPPLSHGSYSREMLWSHCVCVAATSRLISRVCGLGTPEEAYLAGLFHDLGLILVDQTLPRHFTRVLDELTPSVPTCVVENRILSFDHAALGGFVARKWNIPEPIADAITFHHLPLGYRGEHYELVNVVTLANYLCCRAGRTSLGVANVQPPADEVYSILGLDQVTLSIICSELDATLEKADVMAAI